MDTVEGITVSNAQNADYTITVTHKGGLQSGSQNFSLVITGPNLSLSNPSVNNSKFIIRPNPANDIINFKLPTQTSKPTFVSLYDVQGRQVYKETINSRNYITRGQIKTTSLARGVYILRIKQGNTSMQQKVVLK